MLGTLGLLVTKAGTALKPFVPQLQTIFLKCLIDAVCPVLVVTSSMSMRPNILELSCSHSFVLDEALSPDFVFVFRSVQAPGLYKGMIWKSATTPKYLSM